MKKILLLCLLSISFSQQLDYSKMSYDEKVLVYKLMTKNPIVSGIFEIIPTAGYAYTKRWKRGLVVRAAIPATISILTVAYLTLSGSGYPNSENGEYGNIAFGIGYLISQVYCTYDVFKQTSRYNKKLHKQIFGEKASNLGFNLYPIQDGAGISLTYSFN